MIPFFLLLFITICTESVTPNHHIALNKYAQAMNLSNKDKEYLENAGAIVAREVKKTDSEKDSESQDKEPVFDPESFQEFDFISKKGEGLFFPKNSKLSHAGSAFLAYLASAQTTNPTVLEKRDYIISYLEKNPEFKAELIKIIRELHPEMEQSFLELSWLQSDKEKEQRNDFFLNRSNLLLPDFITKRLISQRFVNWFAHFSSYHPYIFNAVSFNSKLFLYFFGSACWGGILNNEPSKPKNPILLLGMFIRTHHQWIKDLIVGKQGQTIFEAAVMLGLLSTVCILPCYSLFKQSKDYYQSFDKSEQSLVAAQKAVQVCSRLDQLLVKHQEFSKHLLLKDALKIKAQAKDQRIQFVLSKFHNNQINHSSFLNYAFLGTRVVVNKTLVDNPEIARQYLFPLLAGLGEIDAYCALSDQFAGYSKPSFTNHVSLISLKQFFHPNIHNPVCNDLDLENKEKTKVFVSGGNGSGKSAITRSVIAAIVAAQTFNRVSAQSAKIPLFDKIAIFANLSDNLGVASKFQVELGKLKKLQEYLEKNPSKKVLLMLDEPLTSTNSELVGKILFDLFGLFAKYQNLMIFCASNTPGLSTIKDAVHMGTIVDTNPDGTFKPTYRWKEGFSYVSDVWFQFKKVFGKDFGTSQ